MATKRKSSATSDEQDRPASRLCSLSHCQSPASGRGHYWAGPLCAEHLESDKEQFKSRFASIKNETDSILAGASQLTNRAKAAQFELTTDRAETADLFEAVIARVNECREKVLGRLDSNIADMEQIQRSLSCVEKLSVDVKSQSAH
ncbi:hypothetical protein BOX15_Mlig007766g1 [Macrostomum lignano]|uniref:Uncharacterized protein n=1 Tax=Macrostomum lignano TaxID=282301 RepID=A0A267FTA4_9PLAT|nr:hypothetical protein BOX15_Mlig007766g3 [Macrostomum lignano]PAA86989.1 hypothetical protein BOX15_Mlig007766g1 [Macrostomum lignano]